MEHTIRQIQNELAQIPGFVRFQMEVTGNHVTICVVRRAPGRRMWEKGTDVGAMLQRLVVRGKSFVSQESKNG